MLLRSLPVYTLILLLNLGENSGQNIYLDFKELLFNITQLNHLRIGNSNILNLYMSVITLTLDTIGL